MFTDVWPTSVWVAAALAPFAGYLVYGFVKESKGRSGVAIAAAAVVHGGLMLLVPQARPKTERPPRVMEIELVEPVQALPPVPEPPALEPPPPDPEREVPQLAPDPVPKKTPPRQRKAKPKRKPDPKPEQPPGPKRFNLGQLNSGEQSGVTVHHGSGGGDSLDGDPRHSGKRPRAASSEHGEDTEGPSSAQGSGSGGRGWAPASQVFIQRLPMPRSVPKRECPATKDGVEGTVFLMVQVRRDGSVRKVTVVKGIGHGCDKIAAAALKKAKFKPAQSNANKPVDFEIRYEYAFRLAG
ncbi:MAG: TonB family protein [Nannocystaceae bacterium]|nr:TonB family protein [Nannocystaceae bacterium]